MVRVVVLKKECVIDGIQRRIGEVVQVADIAQKPMPVKLDNFDESCIRKVLVGKPLEKIKPIEPIEEPKEVIEDG